MKFSILCILATIATTQVLADTDKNTTTQIPTETDANTSNEYFYTTDPGGELLSLNGYHYEEIAAYVPPAGTTGAIPMYRWWDLITNVRFWFTDPDGEGQIQVLGWLPEGIRYYVYDVNAFPHPEGSVPWYRFKMVGTDSGYFYSTSISEGKAAGFSFDRLVGYVNHDATGAAVPLYRWYNG